MQETWHPCKFEEQGNGRQTLLHFQGSYHYIYTLFFKYELFVVVVVVGFGVVIRSELEFCPKNKI